MAAHYVLIGEPYQLDVQTWSTTKQVEVYRRWKRNRVGCSETTLKTLTPLYRLPPIYVVICSGKWVKSPQLILGNPMTDRFNPGQVGDWTFYCDICGQKGYASESTKLATETGKGGLIVCKHDVDKIDYGLIPFIVKVEQNVPYTRINHTDVSNVNEPLDMENIVI